MSVQYNQSEPSIIDLIGGFPQVSKIGQDCYLCSSHEAADHICEDDRFRYIDDLEILELIIMTGFLQDYNVQSHVPSDVPVDDLFLPPSSFQTQVKLDKLASWTQNNKMVLNEKYVPILFAQDHKKTL